MFFKKIKKNKKYKLNEEIIKDIKEVSMKKSGFLEMYKIKNENNKSYVIEKDNEKTFLMNNESRISKAINIPNEFNRSMLANGNNNKYCFKEIKLKKKIRYSFRNISIKRKIWKCKKIEINIKKRY